MAMDMVKSQEFSLIVLDSHTAMIPQKMIDNEMGEATMAVQARMNSCPPVSYWAYNCTV